MSTNDTDASENNRSSADPPGDILSIISGEHSAAKIRSDLMHGLIEGYGNDDVDFGVQIHQEGQYIGLAAGTTWTPEDDPELYTSHALTPEQAREIAKALEEAADKAEETDTGVAAETETESFIRRLLP